MKLRFPAALAAVLATLALPSAALAGTYSSIIVYGDSLSDNGNLYAAVGYPPAPYYMGRFSNGPVAVEQLASALGLPLYDFAFGGATSGIGNYVDGGSQTTQGGPLPGIEEELALSSSLLASPLVSSSLFIVWGGANDFVTGGSAAVAAANIDGIIATLQGDGAQHIIVPGLPDLGLTPDYYGDPAATQYSNQFNAALLAGLPAGATYVNTFALLDQIEATPSAYGITDTTDPCFNSVAQTLCTDPSQYLFFDGFHPTTTVDAIVAEDFLSAAAPEPSSLILLGTGAVTFLLKSRRKKA